MDEKDKVVTPPPQIVILSSWSGSYLHSEAPLSHSIPLPSSSGRYKHTTHQECSLLSSSFPTDFGSHPVNTIRFPGNFKVNPKVVFYPESEIAIPTHPCGSIERWVGGIPTSASSSLKESLQKKYAHKPTAQEIQYIHEKDHKWIHMQGNKKWSGDKNVNLNLRAPITRN